MTGFTPTWLGKGGSRSDSGQKALNRALVAGMMLETIFSLPGLPDDPGARRGQVKARFKTALVCRLAGHIPLQSFRDLAQDLDRWFDHFYPLIASRNSLFEPGLNSENGFDASADQYVRSDLVRESLENLDGLLPTRRHRKLDRQRLLEFLERTRGGWFRLKDFERFFRIDRKTAWEYIQKLLQAGLLHHNQARSAAVRYRLAPKFSGQ
ncbi:MAG: hypothetical protein QME75_01985 [Deltaproteobacteria bacterium]|nr:hypothetical protein [Deltaproteobacteria bacterium]